MKSPKKPKPSRNPIDRIINQLQFELNKYTHYSKREMENYYFVRRLHSYIPMYEKYIKDTARKIEKTASSFEIRKKLNKEAK